MTHPIAITASTPVFTICDAPYTNSKLPGTVITVMSSAATPFSINVCLAPFSNDAVMLSFHSATTMPTFMPTALGTVLIS